MLPINITFRKNPDHSWVYHTWNDIYKNKITHLSCTLHLGHSASGSSQTRAQNASDWPLAAVSIVALHWNKKTEIQIVVCCYGENHRGAWGIIRSFCFQLLNDFYVCVNNTESLSYLLKNARNICIHINMKKETEWKNKQTSEWTKEKKKK